MVVMGSKTHKALSELLEELDIKTLPDGWSGGEARHTGGGIWVREFVHDSRGLRIVYNLSDEEPGVGVEQVRYDDEIGDWYPEEVIEEFPEPETDILKFYTAKNAMESANRGRWRDPSDGLEHFGGMTPGMELEIATPSGGTNVVELVRPEQGGNVATVVDRDDDNVFTIQPQDIVSVDW